MNDVYETPTGVETASYCAHRVKDTQWPIFNTKAKVKAKVEAKANPKAKTKAKAKAKAKANVNPCQSQCQSASASPGLQFCVQHF